MESEVVANKLTAFAKEQADRAGLNERSSIKDFLEQASLAHLVTQHMNGPTSPAAEIRVDCEDLARKLNDASRALWRLEKHFGPAKMIEYLIERHKSQAGNAFADEHFDRLRPPSWAPRDPDILVHDILAGLAEDIRHRINHVKWLAKHPPRKKRRNSVGHQINILKAFSSRRFGEIPHALIAAMINAANKTKVTADRVRKHS